MFQALRKAVSGNYAKDPRTSLVRDEYRKKKLKENLALHIKTLLTKLVQQGQVIERNDEDAANICQALEAIFLHEYEMQTNAIPNINNINIRMMFSEGIKNDDAVISIAFWGLLKEVTHNDVITELKHLVVTTEVGLCRAWIRLALNDGLLVSYITSILSNREQLKRFYGVNAFLMDSELPYILKDMLQGLMQFEFRLNYNSSKLNTWDKKTLELAGILQSVGKESEKRSLHAYIRNSTPTRDRTFSITDTRGDGDKNHFLETSSSSRDGITEKFKSNVSNVGRSLSASTEVVTEKLKSNVNNVFSRIIPKSESDSNDKSEVIQEKFLHVSISEKKFMDGLSTDEGNCQRISKSKDIHNMDVSDDRGEKIKSNLGEKSCKLSDSMAIVSSSSLSDTSPSDYGSPQSLSDSSTSLSESSKALHNQPSEIVPGSNTSSVSGHTPENIKSTNLVNSGVGKVSSPVESEGKKRNTFSSKSHEDSITMRGKNVTVYKIDVGNQQDSGSSIANDKSKQYIDTRQPEKSVASENTSDNQLKTHTQISNTSLTKNENISNSKSYDEPYTDSVDSSSSGNKLNANEVVVQESKNCNNESNKLDMSAPTMEANNAKVTTYIVRSISENTVVAENSDGHSSIDPSEKNETDSIITEQGKSDVGHVSGNRLSGMGWSGWSSTFDNTNYINDDETFDPSESESPGSDENRDIDESFGSLLQIYGNPPNYVPTECLKMEGEKVSDGRDVSSPDKSNSSTSSTQELMHLNFEVVPLNAPLQGENVDKKTLSSLKQLTEIAVEKGLDKQSFCCKYCGVLIGLIYGPYRVCRYDGGYYCYDCHEDEEHIIPARVIQDWDFNRYKVSKYNKLFLMKIEEEPLFHIDELNSLLYDVTPELREMKTLRVQLQHIKEYVQTCRQEIAEDFRRRLWPREYLCDDVHQYSLLDLLQVFNGQQAHHLRKVITQFSKHIYKCTLCRQKGFICEYCNDETIIYPFQVSIAVQCPGCLTTFHRTCRQDKRCPKCIRIRLRMQNKEKNENEKNNRLLVTQKECITSDIL